MLDLKKSGKSMAAFHAGAIWLGCLLLGPGAAIAPAREQVVIQKGVNRNTQLRGADTWLDSTTPLNVNSGTATLRVQNNGAQRALVLFDLSVVPNAGVKTAQLTLNVATAPGAGRTYSANLLTSFWDPANAGWTNRVAGTAWGAAGGDFIGTIPAGNTAAISGTATGPVSWTITQAVQTWYNGTPNYGLEVKDNTESGGTRTTIFSSNEAATATLRPSLTMTFLQPVTNLAITPASGKITLGWSYPTPIPAGVGGSILEAYAGVVILRRQGAPVDKGSAPTDLAALPALCSTIGTGTVVFVGTMANTSFVDDATDTCTGTGNGQPQNGLAYYYKIFTYDTAHYFSSNPAGLAAPRDGSSTFASEAGAVAGGAGVGMAPMWMLGTHSSTLAAPGIVPAGQIDVGTDTNQIFAVNTATGQRLYPAVSLGGIVSGRPPILDQTDASIAFQVMYVPTQDNFIYAIDTTSGAILWQANPGATTTNQFQGGAGVVVKQFSGPSFTLAHDLVIAGTRNGLSTSTNRIVAVDGNTGGLMWTYTGAAGASTALDIMSATPTIDYVHNAVWMTSHSNGGAAQPNLWKLNATTGTRIFQMNVGSADIDSSASLTQFGDVLFVGTNGSATVNGRLYAINPLASTAPVVSPAVQGATVAFYDDGNDGPVHGFPFVVNTTSPYNVVYTTNTQVHAVQFNAATNVFTKLWTTTIFSSPTLATCKTSVCTVSAPVVSTSFNRVYAGGSDGKLYEMNASTGVVTAQMVVNTFYPAVVGDPALDEVNQKLYVSTVTDDQRIYGFSIPF